MLEICVEHLVLQIYVNTEALEAFSDRPGPKCAENKMNKRDFNKTNTKLEIICNDNAPSRHSCFGIKVAIKVTIKIIHIDVI